MAIVTERTIKVVPPVGISKLSELLIDADKDWAGRNITNFGAGGVDLYSLLTAHASRHAAGGADPVFPVGRSNISDFFNSPFWGNIPDKPSTFPPSDHTHTGAGGDCSKVKGIDPTILQAGSGTLDATGAATITFPVPFPAGVTPKVFVSSQDANNSGVVLDITAKSNTGFTVKARKVTAMTHDHVVVPNQVTQSPQPVTLGVSPAKVVNWTGAGSAWLTINTGGSGYVQINTSDTSLNAPAAPSIAFDWLAVNL